MKFMRTPLCGLYRPPTFATALCMIAASWLVIVQILVRWIGGVFSHALYCLGNAMASASCLALAGALDATRFQPFMLLLVFSIIVGILADGTLSVLILMLTVSILILFLRRVTWPPGDIRQARVRC